MRNRRVQCIPWLRITRPHFHLRSEERRFVQAGGGHTDAGGARAFTAGEARAADRAEAAFVFAVHLTWREMVPHGPADNSQCFRRHVDNGRISTAADFLAIATVALEHLDFIRLCGAFVTGGSAHAPACKGWIHCKLMRQARGTIVRGGNRVAELADDRATRLHNRRAKHRIWAKAARS